MIEFYTFTDSPTHDAFAKLCTPDRRIKAIIGVTLDHLITSPLIDIATTILCPETPGLEDAKFKPVGAVNGGNVVLLGAGMGWVDETFEDLVLLEVDANASDVLHFYTLEPEGESTPRKLKPTLRLRTE